jgi:uncharacterized membrane protein YeaQ/YmgE (transglycosylase-associated protein family)
MDCHWGDRRLESEKSFSAQWLRALMGTLMGIGGSVVGGFLARVAGFDGYAGTTITSLVAMVGAVLLSALAVYINGRKIYAHPLQESLHRIVEESGDSG